MEGMYYLTIRESLLMGALVVDCRVSSGADEGAREGINGLTDKIRFEPITTLGLSVSIRSRRQCIAQSY